jgi:DNA-binding response OmpR family regulator
MYNRPFVGITAVPDHTSDAKGLAERRILAVEDDPDLLRLIRRELEAAGFTVWACLSAEQALEQVARQGLPHLALVDILLPGRDGLSLARELQEWSDLPVIMLTSVDEEDTVVRAIETFAEDYIRKPFAPREMVARVERVFRRIGNFGYTLQPVIRVDDCLSIDLAHQKALVAGRPVPLTSTETKLLYVLMRSAGRVVATDFLLRRLWPSDEVFEDTLRVHVHRLRGKIEPQPSRPRYVLTERGTGYRFPPVA